jgi:hypothetical protein
MTKITILILSVTFLSVLIGCEKEAEKNAGNCFDGYMNNGETGADCGGSCAPCQEPSIEKIVAQINGKLVSFENRMCEIDPTVIISGSNDSIQLSINFELIGNEWPLINGVHTKLIYNDTLYETFNAESHVIVTSHNMNEQKISGLFRVEFIRDTTVFLLENGAFSNLTYE